MQSIYEKIESRPERYELNLYITGEDEEEPSAGGEPLETATAGSGAPGEPGGHRGERER